MIRGRTEPRVFTPPLRELTPETSLGFLCVEFCEEVLKVELLPWERWLLIHAMEITGSVDDGWSFRFRVILTIVSRQQGKTFLCELIADFWLFCLNCDLVLGTAQNVETAEEVWEGAISRAEAEPELKRLIARIRRSNGGKSFELVNGGKYKVAAATRKGARGKRSDLVIMDELREQQSWDGWAAVSKTTLARPNAQLWAMSNAGDGSSVVLNHLRRQGHAALGDPDGICGDEHAPAPFDLGDDSLFIAEWSADPALDLDTREGFEEAVRQSNPSLGYGFLTMRALTSARRTDPPEVFMTECLCKWVESRLKPPFPDGAWEAGTDPESRIAPDSQRCWAVDVSGDRGRSSIAVAGLRADRDIHAELVAYRDGIGWVPKWFAERADPARPARVAIQGRGAPASALVEVLAAIDGVEVVEVVGRDVSSWHATFYDSVAACLEDEPDAPRLKHRPQAALDLAAATAQTHSFGDGVWAFDRMKSPGDVSPLIACVLAAGALGKKETVPRASAYEGAGLMVL